MAVYEFEAEDGEVVEVYMTYSEFDRRVKNGTIKLDDGRLAAIHFGGSRTKTYPSCYPMVCSAAGVAPSQIKEHQQHLKEKGCGHIEHTKDGDLVFSDKSQRKKVLEALGMFDRRASYGDPQPKHRTKNCRSFLR